MKFPLKAVEWCFNSKLRLIFLLEGEPENWFI